MYKMQCFLCNYYLIHCNIPWLSIDMRDDLIRITYSYFVAFSMFSKKSIIPSTSSSFSFPIESEETSWTDDTVNCSGSYFFIIYCSNSSSTRNNFVPRDELDGFMRSSFSVRNEDRFMVREKFRDEWVTRDFIISIEIQHNSSIMSQFW